MKKSIFIGAILAMIMVMVALLPTSVVAEEPINGETDLIAGQNMDVGQILVSNDGTTLYVKYVVDEPGWCLTETHLHVATDVNEIPQKKGNPPPGQFDYSESHDCVTEYTYEIPLEWAAGVELYIAAHAVVSNPGACGVEATLYGVERGSGDLYTVDVLGGTATLFADITDPEPGNDNSPNGLAYDVSTGRLYYSASLEGAATSDLYFWDGSTSVFAGTVQGQVAGATFYNGEYYYIVNATDDLVKVTFNGDGTVDQVIDVWLNFAGNDTFRFGDIVIDPEGPILYGSSLSSSGTPPTFFSIDLTTGIYTAITTDGADAVGLQLAFGSNGVLYAQSTGTGNFFSVDPSTGSLLFDYGDPAAGIDGFTDLASGERCVSPSETAWGAGLDFPGKNWATYFTYIVEELTCPAIMEKSDNIELVGIPPNVKVGEYESDEYVRVWKEFEGTLISKLDFDLVEGNRARAMNLPSPSLLAAGEEVCVYYVHLDNIGPTKEVEQQGYLTFEEDILGLIISGGDRGTFAGQNLMFAADTNIGSGTGTIYPTYTSAPDYNFLRGFEVNVSATDKNTDDAVFNDSKVEFTMFVINAHDSLRVILPLVYKPPSS